MVHVLVDVWCNCCGLRKLVWIEELKRPMQCRRCSSNTWRFTPEPEGEVK